MNMELEQLGERIAEQAAHLDAAMHRLLTDLREFDERGGWRAQGAQSCAHWLTWRVGWDLVTARERVRVACKLTGFPAMDDALRRGEVSYSKVRAMLRIATPANEVLLLDHARLMTASQLERLCRKYAVVLRDGEVSHPLVDEQRRYVRRRDTDDGMVKIEAVLHPEEAELVWTMLNHAAKQLAREPAPPAGSDAAASGLVAPALGAVEVVPVLGVAKTGDQIASVISGASACQIDDSAESLEQPSAPATTPTATPAPDDQARAATCRSDDSAESLDQPSAPATTPTATPAPDDQARAATCRFDDSAESLEPASALDTTPTAATGCLATRGIDDSAESLHQLPAPETTPTASIVDLATDWFGDSAESPGPAIQRQSLLDRLLDDADALGGADAAMRSEPEASSSRPQRSSSAPTSQRESSVLHERADAAKRDFSRADALVSLAQGYLRGDRPNRAPIEVVVTIPESSLRAGPIDAVEVGEIGGAFLSSEAARRLSCDAGVVEVVEDEHGAPLSVGRKRRTIAGALQRALRKRDTTCTYPGCCNRIFLEGHHIEHWADGGETRLTNLALLCSLHHRFVHEHGYAIELGPDQRPRFRDPHGRLVVEVPERAVTADVGWPQIRAANAPLSITADTIACGWDGSQADYGAIVGHLVVADGRP